MTSRELSGTTAVVTGASHGFGRGIAIASKAVIDPASGPGRDQDAYLLTATGLSPVQY